MSALAPPNAAPPIPAPGVPGALQLTESEVAEWAATLHCPADIAIAPQVVSTGQGRPVLSNVPGPRLVLRIQDGSEPPGCLQAMGRALAVLHAAPPPGEDMVKVEAPPWETLPVRTWAGLSAAQRQLVGTFHSDAGLRRRGRQTREELREPRVWCHGDARTDNIVITAQDVPLLIDWESAGLGQPEADLGSLCSSLIADSLMASKAPAGGQARAALSVEMARAVVRVRSVISGYRMSGGQVIDSDLLASAVGCGLLARAFVRASTTSCDRIVLTFFEIGRGLLLEPARWEALDAKKPNA